IVVGARYVSVREFVGKLANSLQAALFGDVDQIDFGTVLADGVDFYPRRAGWHHDSAAFPEKLAGVCDRLTEVSGGGGDDVRVLDVGGDIISGPEFEAPRVLQCLTRHDQIDAQLVRQSR